jgi:hypothetical protein
MRALTARLSAFVLLACVAACSQPLRPTGFDVGRSLNADGTIAAHTTVFSPTDTIYVSVGTAGAGSGTVAVRWLYGTRVIGEPTKQVSYRDTAATEFHLQSAAGFPQGAYSVEAILDGKSLGTKTFKVEKQP